MNYTTLFRFAALSAMLLTAILQGCASSTPARFYTLAPVKEASTPPADSVVQPRFTVGVGPVDIPDFLERPQIVTKSGGNELVVAEFDRWAGSLKQDIARVLTADIFAYLAPEASVLSWKRSIPLDWRVAVEVTRLDVFPGHEVVLGAQWAFFDSDGKALPRLHSRTFTEPLGEKNINSAVAAMGNVIGRLGKEIADNVRGEWNIKGDGVK